LGGFDESSKGNGDGFGHVAQLGWNLPRHAEQY
jgi:hypothetical protein